MKLLGGTIYHRLLPLVDPQLHWGRNASRRQRGTERHPGSVAGHINPALLQEPDVYTSLSIKIIRGRSYGRYFWLRALTWGGRVRTIT